MKFTVINVEQGTPEWLAARMGRVTGSRAKDVLAQGRTKGTEAVARRDYRIELLCERLTKKPAEQGFISKEMEWGTEQEPFARMAYEAQTGLIVRETGFLRADDVMVGASVDGDIDDFHGIVEIKCPKTATHLKWLTAGKIPDEHLPQITHNLWVSGAEYLEFISYDSRLPEHLQLFIRRIYADTLDMAAHESEVMAFLRELEAMERQLMPVAA